MTTRTQIHGLDAQAETLLAAAAEAAREAGRQPVPRQEATAKPSEGLTSWTDQMASGEGLDKRSRPRKRWGIDAKQIMEKLEAEGLDPIAVIAKEIKSGEMDPIDRARASLELLSYVAPKLKAVEHTINPLENLTDDELDKQIAETERRIKEASK